MHSSQRHFPAKTTSVVDVSTKGTVMPHVDYVRIGLWSQNKNQTPRQNAWKDISLIAMVCAPILYGSEMDSVMTRTKGTISTVPSWTTMVVTVPVEMRRNSGSIAWAIVLQRRGLAMELATTESISTTGTGSTSTARAQSSMVETVDKPNSRICEDTHHVLPRYRSSGQPVTKCDRCGHHVDRECVNLIRDMDHCEAVEGLYQCETDDCVQAIEALAGAACSCSLLSLSHLVLSHFQPVQTPYVCVCVCSVACMHVLGWNDKCSWLE